MLKIKKKSVFCGHNLNVATNSGQNPLNWSMTGDTGYLKNFWLKFILISLACLFFNTCAVKAAEFNANYLLSDNELTDYTAMDMGQIQSFLEKRDSPLAKYVDPRTRMSAAQIIYELSWSHRINPKYLLVLLQKEQSLISYVNPSLDQYDWATGYGICDDCSKTDQALQKYKGFTNQVDWGAGGTRFYFDNPDKFRYQVNETYQIDDQMVTIANHATRALYIYTPHIHGNENFWMLWQDWFALNYPDGTLLQDADTGGIFLIQNNTRRPFTSKSAFLSRYSLDKLIELSAADLEKYPIGTAIKYAQYSLLQVPTGGIYFLDNETLRPITSKKAFQLLGFNPEEVIKVKEEDISLYPKGEPITIESSYPTGALLQNKKTGGVYFVKNGVKQPLVAKQLLTLYFKNKKIIQVSEEELNEYLTGDPIRLKDSELVRASADSAVYVISNGLRRPIVSAQSFTDLGYKWENVIVVEDKILALHELGEKIDTVK